MIEATEMAVEKDRRIRPGTQQHDQNERESSCVLRTRSLDEQRQPITRPTAAHIFP